jgi:hypothetical protein
MFGDIVERPSRWAARSGTRIPVSIIAHTAIIGALIIIR